MTKCCKLCGKEFNATANKKYCSAECLSYVRNQRALSRYHRNNPESIRGIRFSGNFYRNSPEKLQAIKEKYRNGVSKKQIEDWINSL